MGYAKGISDRWGVNVYLSQESKKQPVGVGNLWLLLRTNLCLCRSYGTRARAPCQVGWHTILCTQERHQVSRQS
jgi:hypothetical protein